MERLNCRRFKCPSCSEVSTQDAWDRETEELCTNREQRRKYVSIGIRTKGRKWYQCPKCHKKNYNTNIKEEKLLTVPETATQKAEDSMTDKNVE